MQKDKRELLEKLYKRDGRKCHYCCIEEKDFLQVWAKGAKTLGEFRYGRRGNRLEIDHKDGNKENDDLANLVLACYACNNAKSDVFSDAEFEKVGKVIRQIWREKKHRQ